MLAVGLLLGDGTADRVLEDRILRELSDVRVVVHPQDGQADGIQNNPAVREVPMGRVPQTEGVEARQAGATAQEPLPTREMSTTELTVSFPWAILSMTTSLVNGVSVFNNRHCILQISELSTNF